MTASLPGKASPCHLQFASAGMSADGSGWARGSPAPVPTPRRDAHCLDGGSSKAAFLKANNGPSDGQPSKRHIGTQYSSRHQNPFGRWFASLHADSRGAVHPVVDTARQPTDAQLSERPAGWSAMNEDPLRPSS